MKRVVFCLLATMLWITSARAVTLPLYYQDDGWTKMGDYLANQAADQAMDVTYVFKSGSSAGSVKLTGANVLDLYRTLEAISEGDWAAARKQSVESGMGYFFPLFGQYLALHGAVKTSISAVVENWSESLYQTKAYRNLVDILNDAIVSQAQNRTPYLPSCFLAEGSAARAQMGQIEDRMYQAWMRTNPDFELSQSSNPARIRQILGKDTRNWREVFNHFLIQAVNDQRDFIFVTYERIREDMAREARRKFYEKTVAALKKQEKLSFSIAATLDTYGGKPMAKKVQNGDILAFESDVFIPFLYNGETAILTWQVYRDDNTPLKALRKEMRIKEGDVNRNARIRFRLDNLPTGRYYTQLTRCINGECQEQSVPFLVAGEFNVTQVFLSPDSKGAQKINRDPFSREARFFHVDYAGGENSIRAELTIRNASGKTITQIQKEYEAAFQGRISMALDSRRFREGEAYTANVALASSAGRQVTKTLKFTPKFYGLKITGPDYVDKDERVYYQFQAPPGLKPPFRLQKRDGIQEISGLSGNRFAFKPRLDGKRTLAMMITDAQGRKAIGFKDVKVIPQPVRIDSAPRKRVAAKPLPKRHSSTSAGVTSSSPDFSSLTSVGRSSGGSGVAASDSRQVARGEAWVRNKMSQIKREMIPSCAHRYFADLEDKTVRDTSQNQLAKIGAMSPGELRSLGKEMTKQSVGMMLKTIESGRPDRCYTSWMNLLVRQGHITSARRDAFVRKEEKYYTVLTMIADEGSDFARPVSWKIVDHKPRTGLFERVPYKYATGGFAYRKWVVAVGPISRKDAQMYCSKAARGKIAVTGNYTPWIPTGGSRGYQMRQQEYITGHIGVRP
ncbi:MAG: hypothetical protein SWH68_16600 [Thermodesulfobacteriota bacterium]|nr:hypothetical protein [Thermodesulfobacteriota bacterium]